MGHTIPTLLAMLAAVPSAAGGCYYVAAPMNTCVNDGRQASQGPGAVQLSATKEACCNTLPRREQQACLATEVPSVVYPDFEKGRCVSGTPRPAVVHPACGVTAAGVTKFVAARFLRDSVRVSDNELCCRRVYGGVGEAAVGRCVGRQGAWYYVDGVGCVWDDPVADDPVVYATAGTVGSLSACPSKYFPRLPAVTCDTFVCPSPATPKPHSIHCGSLESDCTKELCCLNPPAPPAPPMATCSVHTCNGAVGYTGKSCKDAIICAATGCTDSRCCDYTGWPPLLTPPGTLRYPADFPLGGWDQYNVDQYWRVDCESGDVEIDIVSLETELGGDYVMLYSLASNGVRDLRYLASGSYDGYVNYGGTDYSVSKYAPMIVSPRSVLRFYRTPLGYHASKGFALDYRCTSP